MSKGPKRFHRLHYVNKLAWWITKLYHKVPWRVAFGAAQLLLTKRYWQGLSQHLREHFQSLSRRYFSQGDLGRGHHFTRASDIVTTSPTWASFTKRSNVGESTIREVLEYAMRLVSNPSTTVRTNRDKCLS